jgi:hypothetical protein
MTSNHDRSSKFMYLTRLRSKTRLGHHGRSKWQPPPKSNQLKKSTRSWAVVLGVVLGVVLEVVVVAVDDSLYDNVCQ